jgi:hypothetical protein
MFIQTVVHSNQCLALDWVDEIFLKDVLAKLAALV